MIDSVRNRYINFQENQRKMKDIKADFWEFYNDGVKIREQNIKDKNKHEENSYFKFYQD